MSRLWMVLASGAIAAALVIAWQGTAPREVRPCGPAVTPGPVVSAGAGVGKALIGVGQDVK